MNMAARKFEGTANDPLQITERDKILNHNILSEDGVLRYDFMTSLQNIVAAKIATYLWMDQKIQHDITNCLHSSSFFKEWMRTEEGIVDKISQLRLPDSITENLKDTVQRVGKSISDWIEYHDRNFFYGSDFPKICATNLKNIKWTARGKIDYAHTAKSMLADRGSWLTDDQKYKLACSYCLEDEIALIASKVIVPNYLDDYISISRDPMVYYWTSQITGDYSSLHFWSWDYSDRNHTKTSIEEIIFHFLIKKRYLGTPFNEVPIMYMWHKLNEEEKAKNVTRLVRILAKRDSKYSLLSDLCYDHQQQVFKECSGDILSDIFKDWMWGEYFLPTALYVLDIMDSSSYLWMLNKIVHEMNQRDINKYTYDRYKSMFKQLWQKSSKHLREFAFDNDETSMFIYLIKVSFSLSWKRDADLIEMIFNGLNTHQKRSTIFSYRGVLRCALLIESDQWDNLEIFIKCTLSSKEDVNRLKERLITDEGEEIAAHFFKKKALEKIEYFINWAVKCHKELDRLRRSLSHVICKVALESVIINNKVDLTELEEHFRWCAKGDLNVVNELKTKILTTHSAVKLIYRAIKRDKYELLDQVLNWCFSGNQLRIVQFKNSMCKSEYMCLLGTFLMGFLTEKNSFEMLDKFLDWLFTSEQEVEEFKTRILHPQQCGFNVYVNLLVNGQYEIADKFIKWCIPSDKKISKFKNAFVLFKDMCVKFRLYSMEFRYCELSSMLKLLNTSQETMASFKEEFPEAACLNDFYKILDEFFQNQQHLEYAIFEEEFDMRDLYLYNPNLCTENQEDELPLATVGERSEENLGLAH